MAEEERVSAAQAAASEITSKVRGALISRVPYFREQADSLTFEGVRRLLEKDLGFEVHALDAHKRFVKNCLQEVLELDNDDQASKVSADVSKPSTEQVVSPVKEIHAKIEAKESNDRDGETMEDSPVFGLMTGDKKPKTKGGDTGVSGNNDVPNELMIKKAIKERASHLRENSENITMAGVRRLLEEDLKLEKGALDAFKKFVNAQVNEVLTSPEISEKPTAEKKAHIKKNNSSKVSRKPSLEDSSGPSRSDSDEAEEDVKTKKKLASKRNAQNTVGPNKRKRVEEDGKASGRKKSNATKTKSETNSDEEDGQSESGEEKSESSSEKQVKKKEVPPPLYGKRVEHLKSIIKSCGMSVPPSVYKKAKQAPEDKREATLLKELQEILAKEGLPSNPTEKEIKDVKKRKERARELEGIDLSNIVASSRRRSTSSFTPPPKPKIPVESEAESGEDEDDDEDGDDDEDDEEEEVEEQEEEEDNGEDSQSEEEEEENDDDSD